MNDDKKILIVNRGLSFYQYLALIIVALSISNVIDIPRWLLLFVVLVAAIQETIKD